MENFAYLNYFYFWLIQSFSNYDNFKGTQGNFEKRTTLNTDNMGLSYDYGSVMHYGSKAFTVNFNRFELWYI